MDNTNSVLFTLTKLPRAVTVNRFLDELGDEVKSRGFDPASFSLLAHKVKSFWFPNNAVIDLQRLAYLSAGDSSNLKEHAALSRVKLQGTDGIRGKVDDAEYTKREALKLFLEEGRLCPAFFYLNSEAFALYLIKNGGMKDHGKVLIGEDGRDKLTEGRVVDAVMQGFNSTGVRVLNAGIIPTPGVPSAAFHWGCRAGAIITASHNPSNQNGIKLLHDSFKLMDDGPYGEFGLTHQIFILAEENSTLDSDIDAEDVSLVANSLLEDIIISNTNFPEDSDKKIVVVYDGANGVFSEMAPKILKTLPFETHYYNIEAKGYNINQNGGVGELEGIKFFDGKVDPDYFEEYFPVIKAVFSLGRKDDNRLAFGIVNDGDGDRGYLLVYDKTTDIVRVVPGDELAMLVLRKNSFEGTLPENAIYVNSVESDIMASRYAMKTLGINNETACVGDKWLLVPAREGRPFFVGSEESGHVTFGVSVPDSEDVSGVVYTGNGLLSALTGIEYAVKANLSVKEITSPFPQGHKDIRYVYFVDKDLFLPGTKPFTNAEYIALDILRNKFKSENFIVKRVIYSDAPEMLYVAVFDNEGIKIGAVFARNSGTESKTGVAIRCEKKYMDIFTIVMESIHAANTKALKDMKKGEARHEEILLNKLSAGACSREDLIEVFSQNNPDSFKQTDFDALLYAMRKQRVIGSNGKLIHRIEL